MSQFLEADESKTTADSSSFFYLLRFTKGLRPRIALALLLLVLSGTFAVVSARLLGLLVEEGLQRGRRDYALVIGGFVLLAEALAVAVTYYGRRRLAEAASLSLLQIREALFARLDLLPMSYFDRQPVGRVVTRLTYDVEGLEDFFSGTLARLLSAVITFAVALLGMMLTDWKLGLLLTAAILPTPFLAVAVRGPVRRWNREFARRNSAINAKLNEFLNGLPVIRSFGVEAWSQREVDRVVYHHLDAALMANWTNAWSRPLILILCAMPLMVLLAVGAPRVLAGALTLGVFVAFVRYCERVSRPVANIAQEIHTIQAAFTSAERVATFLREDEESVTLGADGAVVARHPRGEIEFDGVTMGYDPKRPVLENVSFRIPAGAKIGLAGTTGSGKTTTVALLARLYEFQGGEIRLDGRPIRDFERSSLRDSMGFVSQDVTIYKGTLRENLAGGRALSDERLLEAARETGLTQVFRRSGLGLDTEILDKGANLSLGERQLVALTRILLRDPSILILDEATANIDPGFEALISRAVEKAMRGRTCLIIAHRLATLRDCDRILVFRGGRLIEDGSHEELARGASYYASLLQGKLLDPAAQVPV